MENFTQILHVRRGFSLLEMSIVIAIIGLLAGAIVAGQSFVRNSELVTTVNDTKYYRDAFNKFETTYGALPGDMQTANQIWATVGIGDGNGSIGYRGALPVNNAEYFLVFLHLARAGMIEGTYTGNMGPAGAADAVLNVNVPQSPISTVGYVFNDFTSGYQASAGGYFIGFYEHPLFVGKRKVNSLPTDPYFTGKEAYRMDSKFDDGRPGAGSMRTYTSAMNADCATDTAVLSAAYVTKDVRACTLIFTQN